MTTLSKNSIRTSFATSAVDCDARAVQIASRSFETEAQQQKAVAACKALLTREKRLERLSELSDAAVSLLYFQIKKSAVTTDSIAKAASYGIDKMIELLEAFASDSALVMRSERDGSRNIAYALDYMKAKRVERVKQSAIYRESGHKTDTQAGYITRTLAALGIAKRFKSDYGFEIELIDSPLTDKVRAIYGLEKDSEA